ncbi:MAG: hypothetical protein Q4E88_02625 [Coriobacteriia bacterium]|nr:hypothetical protein [Coriobacteriia bacterium]
MIDREDIQAINYLKKNYSLNDNNIYDTIEEVNFDSNEMLYITEFNDMPRSKGPKRVYDRSNYTIRFNLDEVHSLDLSALEYVVNNIQGPCAILFRNSFFATGSSAIMAIRKLLFMLGYIEEVANLKDNRNRFYLLDRFSLLVLDPHGDKKVKLTYEEDNKYISNIYDVNTIQDIDYCLSPRKTGALLDSIDSKVVFEDIAYLRNGFNMHRLRHLKQYDGDLKDANDKVVCPLSKSNLKNTYIRDNVSAVILDDKTNIDDYRINPDKDLVLSVRGGYPSAAIIDADDKRPFIATNNLVIITPKENYSKEAVLMYLLSKQFKKYVEAICGDAVLFTLLIKDLCNAPVRGIGNKDKVAKFKKNREEYVLTCKKADELRDQVFDYS